MASFFISRVYRLSLGFPLGLLAKSAVLRSSSLLLKQASCYSYLCSLTRDLFQIFWWRFPRTKSNIPGATTWDLRAVFTLHFYGYIFYISSSSKQYAAGVVILQQSSPGWAPVDLQFPSSRSLSGSLSMVVFPLLISTSAFSFIFAWCGKLALAPSDLCFAIWSQDL